ncbi:EmrB/QacA subfamily drug resistance transporter [Tenacibaculum gallaicum]|uniref:EmrB/QacA subfamily drug resistance transporter n=1 Tax=Tenacibaculum gallaicum TaxID=561505 RepID=A0A3E0HHA3_9FLAO|nr:MFS transporter [Tenacibaculum gallaicum]REH45841.1 EmrB/QacA subfamily drug resistance transporter [Tenacibaculum gallaicum]
MKGHSNKWILASLSLSTLMASLGVSIANVALPTLTEVFSTSFQSVQWVVISYLLSITVMIVSIGRLGDIFGLRRMLMIGVIIYTLASLACGISPTLWGLILARAFQGLGAAILIALTLAFVREAVSDKKTGSAMGMLGTISAIGTALGPTLGGILIENFGWRTIFLIMTPLGVLNMFLIYRYLPITKTKTKFESKKIDWIGTVVLALTLTSYTLAMTIGKGSFDWLNVVLLLLAVFGIGTFMYSQANVKFPLIKLSLFKNRNLSASLIINSFVSTVMMATLVVGPFYLSMGLSLNETFVGMVMSVGPIVSALTGIPSGRIVDYFGSSKIVITGLLIMVLGAFALSILPNYYGVLGYIIALSILTPGYQLFQAANNTSVMMDANKDQRGLISGVLNLSRNLGLITGASVMGALFAFVVGSSDFEIAKAQDISKGMRITFIAAGILIIIAVIISLTTRKKKV